jgi:hypothetical protein
MKRISNKRLTVRRETLKALTMDLSRGQLRYVNGGNFVPVTEGESCASSNIGCGCPSEGKGV